MISTEEIVLSGCLTPLVSKISEKVRSCYFEDPFNQKVFQKSIEFYIQNQIPITKSAFEKSFSDDSSENRLRLEIILSSVSESIDRALIVQACESIKKDYQKRELEAISRDMLNDPDKDPSLVFKEVKQKIVDVESLINTDKKIYDLSSKESELRRIERVDNYRDPDKNIRWSTGVHEIDQWTRGGTPKQLWTIGAISKHGKSTFLYNVAHDLAYTQGLNVLYVDAEMGVDVVETRLHLLHSAKNMGVLGIDSNKFFGGDISEAMSKQLKHAAEDMSDPSKKYGRILFMEASGMSAVDIHMYAEDLHKKHELSAIVIDYAAKLSPIRDRKGNLVQEVNDTFKYLEQVKLNFNNGQGMWVLTGHQINVEGQKRAEKVGIFKPYHLRDAAEAMNSSDVVMGLFRGDQMTGKDSNNANESELLVSFMKNRIGGRVTGSEPFVIEANWKEGRLCDLKEEDQDGQVDFGEEDDILGEEDKVE